MTLGELETLFRSRADDSARTYLWSPEDFRGYLNDTINDACERAFLVEDSTSPEATRITVIAGKHTYPLHPSIVRIERAKLESATNPLTITARSVLDRGSWEDATGRPTSAFDMGASIRLSPTPNADDVLRLVVMRRPLEPLVNDSDSLEEIPEAYQQRLISGVMARAYLKRDVDTYSPQLAEAAEVEFTRWFGMKRDASVARKHRERRSHTTVPVWP